MKKVAVLCALFLPFAFAAMPQSSSRQEQALEAEHEINRAWDEGDVARLGELVLNDYRGTTVKGHVINKGQLLTFVKSAPRGDSRYEEESVWVRGDVAVYTAKVTDTVRDLQSKREETQVTRVTDILIRDGSDWKLQQSQETPVERENLLR